MDPFCLYTTCMIQEVSNETEIENCEIQILGNENWPGSQSRPDADLKYVTHNK